MRIKLLKIENYNGEKDKDFGKIIYKNVGYEVKENDIICFKWNKRFKVIKILS